MRKPDFCLCKNKGVDHLCSNCTTDQGLCFHNKDSTMPHLFSTYIRNFKLLAFICDCTGCFVSEMARNPEDHFFFHSGSCDIVDR